MLKIVNYFKHRLVERSTYILLVTSLGAVAALPSPFNWLGFAALACAALSPDGPINDTKH